MMVVQISIGEPLLRQIHRHPEAKRYGRSAFLRKAAQEYLQRKREEEIDEEIDESYRRAYLQQPPGKEEFGPFGFGVAPWPDE